LPEGPQKGRPFGSSDREMESFFVSLGQVVIGAEDIIITGYPFKPSVAFGHKLIDHLEIKSIDINGYPPTIRVGNELIFVSAEHKEALKIFAEENKVQVQDLPDIWGWILEPFLDTEYTPEDDEYTGKLLESYGLPPVEVNNIRNEVGEQMYKYNFDTMLWDWNSLSILDVLRAMRVKYGEEQFRKFYEKAMEIALLSPVNKDQS